MSTYTFTYKNTTYVLDADNLQEALSEVINYWVHGEIEISSFPKVFIPEELYEIPIQNVKREIAECALFVIADSLPLTKFLEDYFSNKNSIVIEKLN